MGGMHAVDAELAVSPHPAAWLSETALRDSSSTAVRDRDGDHSYRSLRAKADGVHEALQATGLREGDRVALIGRNSALSIAVFLACARAGWVCVPLSFRLTPSEFTQAFASVDPAVVIVDDEFVGRVPRAERGRSQNFREHGGNRLIARRVSTGRASAGHASHVSASNRDNAPLLIVATSGTSRAPKYAVLSHRQCWWANKILGSVFPIAAGDVVLSLMPQHHVAGWNAFALRALQVGATLVLPAEFRSDAVLDSLEADSVVAMMGVPTHYQRLSSDPSFDRRDVTGLTTALVGGAPVPAALRELWHSRGVALREGYGLTEAGPHVLVEDEGRDSSSRGSWLLPYPGVEVRMTDPDTGAEIVGPGVGELSVRSPAMFTGYFRDDQATQRALPDGWLRTGDRAERDAHGRYRVIDRLDDIIISGGENVSPSEVEIVIATHRHVRDCVVVGVADEQWGEVPVALVVVADASVDIADELRVFCREHLAAFKSPARVHIVDTLPRTELGKARRAAARAMLNTLQSAEATEGATA